MVYDAAHNIHRIRLNHKQFRLNGIHPKNLYVDCDVVLDEMVRDMDNPQSIRVLSNVVTHLVDLEIHVESVKLGKYIPFRWECSTTRFIRDCKSMNGEFEPDQTFMDDNPEIDFTDLRLTVLAIDVEKVNMKTINVK